MASVSYWLCGWLKGLHTIRVPGSELMPNLCELAARKGYGVFLLGAQEEVNKGSAEKLCQMYPGLKIMGRANGYFNEEDTPELIKKINASGANILFVALGSPKQEQWIQKWHSELNVNILQGIGGTLDTIVGKVKELQRFSVSLVWNWFYRLVLIRNVPKADCFAGVCVESD